MSTTQEKEHQPAPLFAMEKETEEKKDEGKKEIIDQSDPTHIERKDILRLFMLQKKAYPMCVKSMMKRWRAKNPNPERLREILLLQTNLNQSICKLERNLKREEFNKRIQYYTKNKNLSHMSITQACKNNKKEDLKH